jgi:hypothetical protein
VLKCPFKVHVDVHVDLLVVVRYIYIQHVHLVVAEMQEILPLPNRANPLVSVDAPRFLLVAVAVALAAVRWKKLQDGRFLFISFPFLIFQPFYSR